MLQDIQESHQNGPPDGRSLRPDSNTVAVRGIQRDSADIPLWDRLDKIECPVLAIAGGRPDALLKPEGLEMHRQHLRDGEVIVFIDSGHNPSRPDYGRFIRTLENFLQRIDSRHQPIEKC